METNKINKKDVLTLAAIIGLVGSAIFRIWAKVAAPSSFIGEENLRNLRGFLLLDALASIFTAMFICSLLLKWVTAFWVMYKSNRTIKRELKALSADEGALPLKASRGWLIMTAFVLFSLLTLGVVGIFLFSRGGAVSCLREAVCITDDLSSGKRESISDIEDISVMLYSADNGRLAFGDGCTMVCRDGRDYLFPLSERDGKRLVDELRMYSDYGFKAKYCPSSGVITDYEFCGKIKPSYIKTQAETDRTFGRVPISIEVGEDYVYACRPPEMKMNTGWVILRDGELMTHHPELNEGYTVFAQYYEKLDIDQYIMEEGSYEVYFVRYGDGNVFRLSDSYMFEIEEYMGKPVNLRLVEVPMEE